MIHDTIYNDDVVQETIKEPLDQQFFIDHPSVLLRDINNKDSVYSVTYITSHIIGVKGLILLYAQLVDRFEYKIQGQDWKPCCKG